MFNIDKQGKRFAVIKDNENYDKREVCYSTDLETDGFTQWHLGKGTFQQAPDPHTEREILYIVGASGSGKSTYAKNYIKEYKKMRKKDCIYVFSALKEDETLDEIKDLKRIKMDDSIFTDPIDVEDLANSLCIFDDIDVISNRKIRDATYDLLNQILETGRHFKISCILTNHMPTNGNFTRRILNESHFVIYFPHSGASRQMRHLLIDYLGLERNTIIKNKKLKSRFCMLHKNFPMFVMCEKDIYLLNTDDE